MLKKIGLFSFWAQVKASSLHGYQLTGLLTCLKMHNSGDKNTRLLEIRTLIILRITLQIFTC